MFHEEEAEGAEFVAKLSSLLPLLPPVKQFAEKLSFFCFWLRPWAALGDSSPSNPLLQMAELLRIL